MRNICITYLAVLVSFTLVDLVWLGWIAPDFYKKQIGPLLLERPNLPAGAVFYGLYAAGIVTFVLPASAQSSMALLLGAFFGLCAYGTYDLSNMATLKNWPALLVVVDMIWGAALTAAAALVGFLVQRQLAAG